MFQDDYRRRMDAVTPDPELLARTKNRMEAAGSGARPPRRLTRRGTAAIVVCAALVVSAAAAGPTIWQAIRSDLGSRAPYAAKVEAACEDQGIRIEAQAALADSRITRLYFTMQDLTGEIFRDDTSCDLILSLETCGEFDWGNGGIGLEVLDYDPEQRLAALVYSRGTDELSSGLPTRARLDMTYLLPGERTPGVVLSGEEIPTGILESAVLDTGETVLLPGQNSLALEGADEREVSVTSMGFAADGCFHIRFAQGEGVSPAYASTEAGQPIFSVRYYLFDPENPDRWPSQDMGDAVWTAVEGGWDACLPSLTADTLPYLDLLVLRAHYSVSGGRVEGNWSLTVPVEPVECRAAVPAEDLVFPYTSSGELPYGRTHDGRLERVTVSPLSVCADFSTPEGQASPCQVNGAELPLTVTLTDGTVLTPACTAEVWSRRVGWIAWEFESPIAPEDVESVTLGGETIPIP